MYSHYSYTIVGLCIEKYDENIQCNIYDEVKAQIEDQLEEDRMNPIKEKDRNANIIKKQGFIKKAEPSINPFKTFMNQAKEEEKKSKQESNSELPNISIKLDEIKKKLLYSSEIVEFVQNHSKYIERTLGEKSISDIFCVDKEEISNIDMQDEDRPKVTTEEPLTSLCNFYDDNLTFKSVVTDLQWSTKHPEILLAGYSKSEESNVNDPHGLVLLWSLALRKKPEFQFTCQSELTTAIFHPFNPKLIIGATYTGQILVWDTRGKSLPIMKTPPGGKYHSQPIYCLTVTGSSNSCNIMSISNDGVLCTWSTNNFNKVIKRIELKAKKKKPLINEQITGVDVNRGTNPYQEEFGIISMTTHENESNNIFLGTDDSDIYQVYTHQGNDTNDNIVEVYKNHSGPILSLDMHKEDFYKSANVKLF